MYLLKVKGNRIFYDVFVGPFYLNIQPILKTENRLERRTVCRQFYFLTFLQTEIFRRLIVFLMNHF